MLYIPPTSPNELSNSLYSSRQLQEMSAQNMMKELLQPFPDDLLNGMSENKPESENAVRVNPIKMRLR